MVQDVARDVPSSAAMAALTKKWDQHEAVHKAVEDEIARRLSWWKREIRERALLGFGDCPVQGWLPNKDAGVTRQMSQEAFRFCVSVYKEKGYTVDNISVDSINVPRATISWCESMTNEDVHCEVSLVPANCKVVVTTNGGCPGEKAGATESSDCDSSDSSDDSSESEDSDDSDSDDSQNGNNGNKGNKCNKRRRRRQRRTRPNPKRRRKMRK